MNSTNKKISYITNLAKTNRDKIVDIVLEELNRQLTSNNEDRNFLEALMFPNKNNFPKHTNIIKEEITGKSSRFIYAKDYKYSDEEYADTLKNSTHALVVEVYNYFLPTEKFKFTKEELLKAISERKNGKIPEILLTGKFEKAT